MNSLPASSSRRSALHLLCLLSAPFLLYFNAYQAGFHFDDKIYILNSHQITNISECLHDLGRFFFIPDRTIVTLSFALNYALHGFDLTGYHVVNIFLHALNCCLLYLLLNQLLRQSDRNAFGWDKGYFQAEAFYASLIFLVHPLAVNSVTYITQRHVLLATFFYIGGFLYYSYAQQQQISLRIVMVCSSIVCFWLAIHSKQMAVSLPFVLLGYECIVQKKSDPFFNSRIRLLLIVTFCLSIAGVVYALKIGLFHTDPALVGFRAMNLGGTQAHIFTEIKIFLHYLRLFFLPLPSWLCVDHAYPLARSMDWALLPFIAGHILLGALAIGAFVRGIYLITFGIYWFYMTLSIPYLFLPSLDVMVEYKTYLPSIGIIFIVAEGFRHVHVRYNAKVLTFVVLPLIVLASWVTFQRNEVFRTEMSFWSDVIEKYPQSPRPYNNRGLDWHAQGQYEKAIEDFQKAISLEPNYSLVHANIGDSYRAVRDFERAIFHYKEYIRLSPESADGYVRLGNIYAVQNNWQQAVQEYDQAVKLDPKDMGAYYNLGLAFNNIGEKKQSLQIFKKIVERDPLNVMALTSLGVLYYTAGERNLGAKYFQSALDVNPLHSDALYNLAAWHAGKGEIQEALKLAEQLTKVEPQRGLLLIQQLTRR